MPSICHHLKKAFQLLCRLSLLSCSCPPGALYCAVRSYVTKKDDEVSVPIGSVVEVLRKSDDGWWLIRYLILSACCRQ